MHSNAPRVIITCGPSFEPLDEVRRITNFSSGELGMILAKAFVEEGFAVECFKGSGATTKLTVPGAEVVGFDTNADLDSLLAGVENKECVAAVFHAAALCDFRIKEVRAHETQAVLSRGKVSSRAGDLQLLLEPALKLISRLREYFPASFIVGWKYEVEGDRASALGKGRRQIEVNRIDACVVNGPAFGSGFGYLPNSGELVCLDSKAELSRFLGNRLRERPAQQGG